MTIRLALLFILRFLKQVMYEPLPRHLHLGAARTHVKQTNLAHLGDALLMQIDEGCVLYIIPVIMQAVRASI